MTYLRSMGDDSGTATSSPAAALVRQVNRFVKAPVAYQFVTTPIAPTDIVTPELALAAVLIYQRSATDSFAKFHDDGSRQAIEAANAAFSNPVAFVSSRMGEVTTTAANMADSLGLPGAGGGLVGGMSTSTIVLIVGLVGAMFFMHKRGGR